MINSKTVANIFSSNVLTNITRYVVLFFSVGVSFAFVYMGQNGDEDFYITAVNYVYSGKSLYTDFSFPGMPLIPYFYGFAGGSLISMRLLGVLYLAITVLIWIRIINHTFKLNNDCVSIFLISVLSSGTFIYFCIQTPKYILTLLLFSLAYYIYFNNNFLRHFTKIFIIVFLLCIAVGIRLSVLPAAIGFFLLTIFWLEEQSIKSIFAIFFGSALIALLVFLPFLSSLDKFLFQAYEVHTLRVPPSNYWGWHLSQVKQLLRDYSILWLLLPLSVYFGKNHATTIINDKRYVLLSLVIVLLFVPQFIMQRTSAQYFTNVIPLLLLLLVLISYKLIVKSKLFLTIFLLGIILNVYHTPVNRLTYPFPYIQKLTEIINTNTNANDIVFTLRNRFVINANRNVYPGTEMGQISFRNDNFEDSRIKLISKNEVYEALNNKLVTMVLWSKKQYSFDRYFPMLTSVPRNVTNSIVNMINEGFEIIYEDDNFVIYKRRKTTSARARAVPLVILAEFVIPFRIHPSANLAKGHFYESQFGWCRG